MTLLPCVSYESKGHDFCGPLYLYGRLHNGNQYLGSTGFRKRWSPPQNRRSRDREGGKLSKKKGGRRVSGSRDVGRDSSNPPVLKQRRKKLSCYQGKTRESKKVRKCLFCKTSAKCYTELGFEKSVILRVEVIHSVKFFLKTKNSNKRSGNFNRLAILF